MSVGLPRASAQSGAAGQAVTADGNRFAAKLLGIGADWKLLLDAEGQRRELPAAELVRWGNCRDASRGPLVLLTDGSLLAVDDVNFGERELTSGDPLWGDAAVSWKACRGIVLQTPRAALPRDALVDRVAVGASNNDWLLLENGDVVAGELVGVAAAAGDQGGQGNTIAIKIEGETIHAPRDKIAALALAGDEKLSTRPAALRVWLGFADGSRLLADGIATQGDRVVVSLACGIELQADAAAFYQTIALVQPLSPRVDYLSDLPGFGYKHVPFLDLQQPYHTDRNALGAQLRHDGAVYMKGIGMHSASRLAFELAGKYRRFEAELAIDEAAGSAGSAVFRIYTSGASGGLAEALASDVVRGGAATLPISIDVSNVQRLVLVVEFADRGDQLDYADWLDARLIR